MRKKKLSVRYYSGEDFYTTNDGRPVWAVHNLL